MCPYYMLNIVLLKAIFMENVVYIIYYILNIVLSKAILMENVVCIIYNSD